jgi:hypothetical protein
MSHVAQGLHERLAEAMAAVDTRENDAGLEAGRLTGSSECKARAASGLGPTRQPHRDEFGLPSIAAVSVRLKKNCAVGSAVTSIERTVGFDALAAMDNTAGSIGADSYIKYRRIFASN